MDDYEVEHDFPGIGCRTMLLNARKVFYEGNSHTTMLLGIEDITSRSCTSRANANPSIFPGMLTSVNNNCTSESASNRSNASSPLVVDLDTAGC